MKHDLYDDRGHLVIGRSTEDKKNSEKGIVLKLVSREKTYQLVEVNYRIKATITFI
jgi:hypothetical protein